MQSKKLVTFDREGREKAGFDWFYEYNNLGHITGVVIERDCGYCKRTEDIELSASEIVQVKAGRPVEGLVPRENGVLIPRVCPTCKSKYSHNIDLQKLAQTMTLVPVAIIDQWVDEIRESIR